MLGGVIFAFVQVCQLHILLCLDVIVLSPCTISLLPSGRRKSIANTIVALCRVLTLTYTLSRCEGSYE